MSVALISWIRAVPGALRHARDFHAFRARQESQRQMMDVAAQLDEALRTIAQRDARIAALEEEQRFKAQLRHEGNALWHADDPTPYCSTCYEGEHKRVHMDIAPHNPAWATCNRCKKSVKIGDDGTRWDQPLRRRAYRVPRLRDS